MSLDPSATLIYTGGFKGCGSIKSSRRGVKWLVAPESNSHNAKSPRAKAISGAATNLLFAAIMHISPLFIFIFSL